MSHIVLRLAIVLALVAACPACAEGKVEGETWRAPRGEFEVLMPAGWKKADLPAATVWFVNEKSAAEKRSEFITVNAIKLVTKKTLDEVVASSKDGFAKLLPDVKYLEDGPTTLAGIPAHRITCAGKTAAGKQVQITEVIAHAAKTRYAVKFTTSPDRYEALKPTIAAVLASFKPGPEESK
ncbi:MAG: hypothetical protein ACAI43_03135 [Phycisphaerae bacterium]|nr:hypothetical protein [Tepidisphaeraceae bacterium]